MNAPMVKSEGVHKSFGSLQVLKGIDLEVQRGEVFCLVGPSGSGKSTFLRCINHLEKIDSGRLSVDGELVGYRQHGDKLYELKDRDAAKKRREIGMVFQRFNLFPHMTVMQNVIEAPIRVRGESADVARARAVRLLDRVGLSGKADAYPRQLSGGQQQRVAIARALVNQPRIILADEPTGNLDSKTSEEIMDLFNKLNKEGITIIIVTHENDIADHASRQVRFLDGKIVEDRRNKKEKAEA